MKLTKISKTIERQQIGNNPENAIYIKTRTIIRNKTSFFDILQGKLNRYER